jgi:transposase
VKGPNQILLILQQIWRILMVWTPFTRAEHNRSGLHYPSDFSDAEWRLIAPLLPAAKRGGRPRSTDMRAVMNGIFYLLASGCQWALLPKDFPPRSTVYHYFKRLSNDGTLARIHDAFYCQTRDLEGKEGSPSYAIIDSQSVKTGPDARDMVGFDAGKKVKGRKRHILVDTLGLILKCEVHAASIQDRDGAALVFDKLTARFPFIEKICGDGGYQGPIAANSNPRPMEIVKRNGPGFQVLPKRWIVERTFAWLGINRRLTKDFERFASTSLAFIQVAMMKLMVRRLARYQTS